MCPRPDPLEACPLEERQSLQRMGNPRPSGGGVNVACLEVSPPAPLLVSILSRKSLGPPCLGVRTLGQGKAWTAQNGSSGARTAAGKARLSQEALSWLLSQHHRAGRRLGTHRKATAETDLHLTIQLLPPLQAPRAERTDTGPGEQCPRARASTPTGTPPPDHSQLPAPESSVPTCLSLQPGRAGIWPSLTMK